MKLKLIFFALFFASFVGNVSAQQPNLRLMGQLGGNGIDTLGVNAPLISSLVVQNLGPVAFSGDIFLTAFTNGDSANPFVLDTIPSVTLNPNDTTTLVTTFLADLSKFDGGINIVVVWPAAQNATFETLTDTIFIDTTGMTGLQAALLKQEVVLFPNPAHSRLYFSYGEQAPQPARISVLNSVGQEVFFTSEQFGEVDLRSLTKGMYFVRIRFRDGQVFIGRFLKE